MSLDIFPPFVQKHYELHEWRHASAILGTDFPNELADLVSVLTRFRLRRSWISVGGGNRSQVSAWIDEQLFQRGWTPKCFDTRLLVDGKSLDSPTHEVDCFKQGGGGAGCPLLVLGIRKSLYDQNR